MDRFVVRVPRGSIPSNTNNYNSKKNNKQRTLESLSGVVILQDVQKQKKILESPSKSAETKLTILEELSGKSPGTQVLIDTGIGKTVNRLRKNPDSSISLAAEQLYIQWKELLQARVEKSKNTIEVKSDTETERLRNCSRKFIQKSLEANEISSAKDTATLLEKYIYKTSSKLVGKEYRRLSRKVVFGLKAEEYKGITITSEQAKQIVQSNQ